MIMGLRPSGVVLADSCPGDSGGPAYVLEARKFVPVGLVSRGVTVVSRNLCGTGGIYTLLGRDDLLAWLHKRLPDSSRTRCAAPAAEPQASGVASHGAAK